MAIFNSYVSLPEGRVLIVGFDHQKCKRFFSTKPPKLILDGIVDWRSTIPTYLLVYPQNPHGG